MADCSTGIDKEKKDNQTKSPMKDKITLGGLSRGTTGIKLKIGQKRKTDELTKDESLSNTKVERKSGKDVSSSVGVSISLSAKSEKDKSETSVQKKKGTVATAFADDSDSGEEEMPKEARMRMRNIGRETPTSAGPNSYNKGKQGFINRNKMWEKELKPRIHLEKPPDK